MNCKNCDHPISEKALFCEHCGAKIVKKRITLKNIVTDLATTYLGWDNRFLLTVKKMIIRPQDVFTDYFNGVRKRYVNPFTFFAIGTAIAVFIFSFFMKTYLDLNEQYMREQTHMISKLLEQFNIKGVINLEEQLEIGNRISKLLLKYLNLISFINLPLYALMTYFTYNKKHNYGEHLIMNAYIQGFTFLTSSLLFIISSYLNPSLYNFSYIIMIFYYIYIYNKLYKLDFWESFLKFLKFLLLFLASFIIIMILGILIGFLSKL